MGYMIVRMPESVYNAATIVHSNSILMIRGRDARSDTPHVLPARSSLAVSPPVDEGRVIV